MGIFFSTNEELCQERIFEIKHQIRRRELLMKSYYKQIDSHFKKYDQAVITTDKNYYLSRIKRCNDFIQRIQQDILKLEFVRDNFEHLRNSAADREAIDMECMVLEKIKQQQDGLHHTETVSIEELITPIRPGVEEYDQAELLQIRLEALSQNNPGDKPIQDEVLYLTL